MGVLGDSRKFSGHLYIYYRAHGAVIFAMGGRRYVPHHCSLGFDVMYHGAGGAGDGGLLVAVANDHHCLRTKILQVKNTLCN